MRGFSPRFLCLSISVTDSHQTSGYCWPTCFNVLGVLFLGKVFPAFLPSKKACWTHKFGTWELANSIRAIFASAPQLSMYKRAISLAYEISPMYRESLQRDRTNLVQIDLDVLADAS